MGLRLSPLRKEVKEFTQSSVNILCVNSIYSCSPRWTNRAEGPIKNPKQPEEIPQDKGVNHLLF
jgi:hypothetical protein